MACAGDERSLDVLVFGVGDRDDFVLRGDREPDFPQQHHDHILIFAGPNHFYLDC